ncbi:MAG: HDOD domain-containing protein [Leptospirales bacterium]
MFSTDEFALMIEDLSLMPAISPTTSRIFEKMDDEQTSISLIATLIEEDPGLSSRLLKVANSPFYPYSGTVASVREALIRLGLSSTRGIILTTSLFDKIRGEQGVLGLWQHSLAVAMTSRKIASSIRYPLEEEVSMAGLLHDIGKVPYYMFAPERMRPDGPLFDTQMEKNVFGLDHMEAGARLVSSWHFPAIIRQPIRWHQEPFLSPAMERTPVLIVALADQIVQGFGMGHLESFYGQETLYRVREELQIPEERLLRIMKEFLLDRELILKRSQDVL